MLKYFGMTRTGKLFAKVVIMRNTEGRSVKLPESTINIMPQHLRDLFVQLPNPVVALFPQSSVTGKRSAESRERFDPASPLPGSGATNRKETEYTDSGSAARFFNAFPPEADPIFYHAKASKADRAGSRHPTVKPVALMQWLCRLVTPPGGTILDPFGGSGTTAEAARREGFDCILMEAEDQFVADIRRRFDLPDPIDPLLRMLDTPADEFADILG